MKTRQPKSLQNKLAFSIFLTFFFIPSLFAAEVVRDLPPVSAQSTLTPSATLELKMQSDGYLTSVPGEIFSTGITEGITLPYLIETPELLKYPRWVRRQGIEGELVVAVEILTDGSVGRSMVTQSSGFDILDSETLKTIKTWKFQPAMQDGEALVECVQIPIRFQLEGEEKAL